MTWQGWVIIVTNSVAGLFNVWLMFSRPFSWFTGVSLVCAMSSALMVAWTVALWRRGLYRKR